MNDERGIEKDKSNGVLPYVSGSFSVEDCKNLIYYGKLKDGSVKLDEGTKHLDYFLTSIFDSNYLKTRFKVIEAEKMFWDRIRALANYR